MLLGTLLSIGINRVGNFDGIQRLDRKCNMIKSVFENYDPFTFYVKYQWNNSRSAICLSRISISCDLLGVIIKVTKTCVIQPYSSIMKKRDRFFARLKFRAHTHPISNNISSSIGIVIHPFCQYSKFWHTSRFNHNNQAIFLRSQTDGDKSKDGL